MQPAPDPSFDFEPSKYNFQNGYFTEVFTQLSTKSTQRERSV
jgi:hypothetical protein